ncbi:hypothetical protein GWI33_007932 [Rhynchophorus ferrugineus]|uniref:VWFA domain-containing protein n=1 Tax=Rhynchophorus ferrugineus TaxID=354439 RepID=A0A834IS00_RHYFE|nr:hypothetical protein GWI33_007932 [Rhynchophorus ferrugineus]
MYRVLFFALSIIYCSCIVINSESGNTEIIDNCIENITFSTGNITLLVDKNPDSFKQVLQFVNQATTKLSPNFSLTFFNASGVFTNLKSNVDTSFINQYIQFLLNESKNENNYNIKESLVFFALLETTQIIPKNSIIVVFVNAFNKSDIKLAKYMLNILKEKKIQLYAVINNEESTGYKILKDLVLNSGGRLLKNTTFSNFITYPKEIQDTKLSDVIKSDRNNNSANTLLDIIEKFKNNKKYGMYEIDNTSNATGKRYSDQITPPSSGRLRDFKIENIISNIFGNKFGNTNPAETITIEVGLGSELITSALKISEVYFEVRNTGISAQTVSFSCTDDKQILSSLSEYRRDLQPEEITTVVLYLSTKAGIYQDEIIFWAKTRTQSYQKKVLVDVGTQIVDQTSPELTYKYTSDCTGLIFSKCSKGTWTMEINAKDSESGLMSVNSLPKGIYFPEIYSAGTTDTVTGYYSDSCCKPDIQISAVDRMNNKISYTLNAYNTIWSPGAIAALVLGILLFLILIALIIYFVIKKRKQKESYNLPRYKGRGGI